DLSTVWVEADVFESQAGWIAAGQRARMTLPSAPGREWQGEVDYVYPTIRPESRTARARIVFDNPQLVLKPGMYTNVRIDAAPRNDVVVIPSQAVIRSAHQERVVLALGAGRFRPAEVVTGLESDGRTEIIEGLAPGERIVISAQFLIDSEASTNPSLLRMLGEGDDDDFEMEGMDHDASSSVLPRSRGSAGARSGGGTP
ncbi:MAG: efflux RND transporter periplasmic adaptor subunit, partial [Wenzhouxiangellaceae bacterium]